MKLLEAKRMVAAAAVMTSVWMAGITLTARRAESQQKAPTADQVFKNIQVLKGTTVDDFMGTMGVMSAALGFDCSECHVNAGTDKVDWAADTRNKVIARKMVTMMQPSIKTTSPAARWSPAGAAITAAIARPPPPPGNRVRTRLDRNGRHL